MLDFPNELWLQVFEYAAACSCFDDEMCEVYIPFQGHVEQNMSLTVKRTLVQVCRKWRDLTTELLYRDVKIRHGQTALKDALEHEAYGHMVRSIELPYQCTATEAYARPLMSVEILRLCDHLETLVRPRTNNYESVPFEFDAEAVSLPSLKRLEWWQNSEAERTGGINSLGEVVRSSPHLRYLFVGNNNSAYSSTDPRPVCLPELQVLRLYAVSGMLLHQISQSWSLPNLTHIIIDCPPLQMGNDMSCLWEVHGPQLQVVEFGKNMRFMITDLLTSCLAGCPNLRELNYYLLYTSAPMRIQPHTSLSTVGLHFSQSGVFDDENQMWELIENHFDHFLDDSFPNLESVYVFGDHQVGDWDDLTCHSRFAPLEDSLRERNVVLHT